MDGEWKRVAVALLCAAGVSVLLLKWREEQKVKRKLQRAREKREKELGWAEKAVSCFKTRVNKKLNCGTAVLTESLKHLEDIESHKDGLLYFSIKDINPIYGRTVNPCDLEKTCGGSSGGEGALIAGGGSILGLATDLGGSIRILAAFCGICGLKTPKQQDKAIQGGVGLPIAVQCVALPWQEEMCLRLMREVEKLSVKNKRSDTH